TAAVAGREIAASHLASIADCDDVRWRAAVRDALTGGLLVEVSGAPARYRFSHDLVRESVYLELSSVRRARPHRPLCETLETAALEGEDIAPADLAYHFVAAARGAGDPAKAVHYATRAAEAATAALAYEDAIVEYERALEAGAAIAGVDRVCLL